MIDRSFHPDVKAVPYWSRIAPPDDTRVDVLIVGSRFAGRSTNRRALSANIPFRTIPLYKGKPWFVRS